MSWKFGVLDKDSGVRMALEEMEADYNEILYGKTDKCPDEEVPSDRDGDMDMDMEM